MLDERLKHFFYWIEQYHSILTNLIGEDRAEAVAVMDDDKKFDAWMEDYSRKQDMKALNRGDNTKPGMQKMAKADMLKGNKNVGV